MKNFSFSWLLWTASFVFLSCGEDTLQDTEHEESGIHYSTMTRSREVDSASSCPNGGVALDYGVDRNGNGVLDTDEVSGTEHICHGRDGEAGKPCTVTDNQDGTKTIRCPDDAPVVISDATITTIAASIFCSGLLENTTIFFSYNAVVLTSGDVWAVGSVRAGYGEFNGSSFYAASQVGAQNASITVQADFFGTANAGWWALSVDRITAISTVVANDPDLDGGNAIWTMTPDKCVLHNY